MIFRSPWNGFPDVAVQTTVPKLKSHPDCDAAKHGDQDAALRVIAQVFKPGKVTDSCDLIVPVLQLDQGKQNMLAIAYALRLVLARDNQTVIQRRAQLLGERQAGTQDHKRGHRL